MQSCTKTISIVVNYISAITFEANNITAVFKSIASSEIWIDRSIISVSVTIASGLPYLKLFRGLPLP